MPRHRHRHRHPGDRQRKLFEKFYRADNAVAVDTEGTGLGLYLVRLIVERSGGQIAANPAREPAARSVSRCLWQASSPLRPDCHASLYACPVSARATVIRWSFGEGGSQAASEQKP